MSLYRQKDSQNWYAALWHNGRSVRRTTGTTDKAQAQRIHDQFKAELWSEPRTDGKTWNDACVKWLKARERSQPDKLFLANFGYVNRPLSECTVESFEEMFDEEDISASTYNRRMGRVQAILRLAGETFTFKRRTEKQGRIRFLTRAEWHKLRAALPCHLQGLATFAILTGLRKHNVTHLEWNEVDLQRKLMWVHPDQAKSGKAIGIPLPEAALPILKAQLGQHERWVFPYRGEPIYDPKKAFATACAAAGIENFTWHGLRHTWASWHVMAGTPLEVLQKLGGWASLKLVMRYAHLAENYVARYADNAKPWAA